MGDAIAPSIKAAGHCDAAMGRLGSQAVGQGTGVMYARP